MTKKQVQIWKLIWYYPPFKPSCKRDEQQKINWEDVLQYFNTRRRSSCSNGVISTNKPCQFVIEAIDDKSPEDGLSAQGYNPQVASSRGSYNKIQLALLPHPGQNRLFVLLIDGILYMYTVCPGCLRAQ